MCDHQNAGNPQGRQLNIYMTSTTTDVLLFNGPLLANKLYLLVRWDSRNDFTDLAQV